MLKNALCAVLLLVANITFAKIAEMPFTEYSYNPNSCQGIRHGSGSQIFIPEQAFVLKKDGKTCGKKIIIKYREFHSQADIVAANIPMAFMRGKQKHQLESGGMFEILAFCDGEPMELAKGKQIQVRFACKNDLENLDAFFFEPEKGWQLLNTPVTDFSVRKDGRDLGELWGNVPPQTNIGSSVSMFVESIPWNPEDPFDKYDSIIFSVSIRLPGVFRGMNIAKMGLYNYDRILNEEGSIPFAADFKIKGSEEKIQSTVYVTYSEINSVIYYGPDDWKERFALLPRKDLKIFTMLKDGRIAIFSPADMKKLDITKLKNKTYTFELEIVEGAPKTKQQLAQKTGINQ